MLNSHECFKAELELNQLMYSEANGFTLTIIKSRYGNQDAVEISHPQFARRKAPAWTSDWAALGPLMAAHVNGYTISAWGGPEVIGVTTSAGLLSVTVDKQDNKEQLLMYAIVLALTNKLRLEA